MLKGKYCMKKLSRLDPDHFLSLALPCPRSLILQQLNIFKVFFMRHLGLVGLLANMLVGRSRFETGWVIVLCICTKYFLLLHAAETGMSGSYIGHLAQVQNSPFYVCEKFQNYSMLTCGSMKEEEQGP